MGVPRAFQASPPWNWLLILPNDGIDHPAGVGTATKAGGSDRRHRSGGQRHAVPPPRVHRNHPLAPAMAWGSAVGSRDPLGLFLAGQVASARTGPYVAAISAALFPLKTRNPIDGQRSQSRGVRDAPPASAHERACPVGIVCSDRQRYNELKYSSLARRAPRTPSSEAPAPKAANQAASPPASTGRPRRSKYMALI